MSVESLLENLKMNNEDVGVALSGDLPTMFDLPSESPEEPGLPDIYHAFQAFLLTETFQVMVKFFTGIDLNLYYDPKHPDRYKRPDWFAALGVDKLFAGEMRRSYVIWQERVRPFVVAEFLSPGTEAEDLGRTEHQPGRPPTKWMVYEQILKIPYYVVFDRFTGLIRAYKCEDGHYQPLTLTADRISMPEIGLELRTWWGSYQELEGWWLRWFDASGKMVLAPAEQAQLERAEKERERAEKERERAEKERERAEKERERAEKERLLALLKKAGIDPDQG